jgi:hypothetical protein
VRDRVYFVFRGAVGPAKPFRMSVKSPYKPGVLPGEEEAEPSGCPAAAAAAAYGEGWFINPLRLYEEAAGET